MATATKTKGRSAGHKSASHKSAPRASAIVSKEPSAAKGYAAQSATSPLAHFDFVRRAVGPKDVQIEIMYCGVCHSDLHTARNEWKGTTYPCVPGHEIIGRVTAVGSKVKKFKVGGMVGVGCMVGSCRGCASCKQGLEQYCDKEITFTYNSIDHKAPTGSAPGTQTYGGYSSQIVVDEDFVLKLPKGMDPAAAAPLLCAGITTYSPLRHWNVKKGQ
ncbi:MAG: alcohol dehydrogenase catalytic domain-containing protein [Phycisphaerales bacterium]|nr:alcohol dehydrogenase catalytic domain-containing protein [Phycisphaerales bacterium]